MTEEEVMTRLRSPRLGPEVDRDLRAHLAHIEGEVWKIRQLMSHGYGCEEVIAAVLKLKRDVAGVAAELVRGHAESCLYTRPSLAGDEEGVRAVRFLVESALE